MTYIDVEHWNRKRQYEQFSTFFNPCYTIGKYLDVTHILEISKTQDLSFFTVFLYHLTQACNHSEGFRLRMDDQKRVICHEQVSPSFTVLLEDNSYDLCITEADDDFHTFYQACRTQIERTKQQLNAADQFNGDGRTDLLYCSCLPWVDAEIYDNPLPLGDPVSLSIPRISWSRYMKENDRYKMFISFTVNHALIDGYELSQLILQLQESLDAFNPKQ